MHHYRAAAVTAVLLAACWGDAKAQQCSYETPGIRSAQLANGQFQYYGRVLMKFPEDNESEHSVRQVRIYLPRLLNDTPTTSNEAAVPVVQTTFEGNGIGSGESMLLFSMERLDDGNCTEFLIDAQTPYGVQTQITYYVNISVIGTPAR